MEITLRKSIFPIAEEKEPDFLIMKKGQKFIHMRNILLNIVFACHTEKGLGNVFKRKNIRLEIVESLISY